MKIEFDKLSVRLTNLLKDRNINDTEDFQHWTGNLLFGTRNMGKITWNELQGYLKENGIDWEDKKIKENRFQIVEQIEMHLNAISVLMRKL